MPGYKLTWKGNEAQKDVHKGGAEGLKQAAEFLLSESNKIAPIDEGTLINSGNTSVDKAALEATVSYDTPYAIAQHERIELHHANGRQAKFLESAYKSNISAIRDFIASSIKEKLS